MNEWKSIEPKQGVFTKKKKNLSIHLTIQSNLFINPIQWKFIHVSKKKGFKHTHIVTWTTTTTIFFSCMKHEFNASVWFKQHTRSPKKKSIIITNIMIEYEKERLPFFFYLFYNQLICIYIQQQKRNIIINKYIHLIVMLTSNNHSLDLIEWPKESKKKNLKLKPIITDQTRMIIFENDSFSL